MPRYRDAACKQSFSNRLIELAKVETVIRDRWLGDSEDGVRQSLSKRQKTDKTLQLILIPLFLR